MRTEQRARRQAVSLSSLHCDCRRAAALTGRSWGGEELEQQAVVAVALHKVVQPGLQALLPLGDFLGGVAELLLRQPGAAFLDRFEQPSLETHNPPSVGNKTHDGTESAIATRSGLRVKKRTRSRSSCSCTKAEYRWAVDHRPAASVETSILYIVAGFFDPGTADSTVPSSVAATIRAGGIGSTSVACYSRTWEVAQ